MNLSSLLQRDGKSFKTPNRTLRVERSRTMVRSEDIGILTDGPLFVALRDT